MNDVKDIVVAWGRQQTRDHPAISYVKGTDNYKLTTIYDINRHGIDCRFPPQPISKLAASASDFRLMRTFGLKWDPYTQFFDVMTRLSNRPGYIFRECPACLEYAETLSDEQQKRAILREASLRIKPDEWTYRHIEGLQHDGLFMGRRYRHQECPAKGSTPECHRACTFNTWLDGSGSNSTFSQLPEVIRLELTSRVVFTARGAITAEHAQLLSLLPTMGLSFNGYEEIVKEMHTRSILAGMNSHAAYLLAQQDMLTGKQLSIFERNNIKAANNLSPFGPLERSNTTTRSTYFGPYIEHTSGYYREIYNRIVEDGKQDDMVLLVSISGEVLCVDITFQERKKIREQGEPTFQGVFSAFQEHNIPVKFLAVYSKSLQDIEKEIAKVGIRYLKQQQQDRNPAFIAGYTDSCCIDRPVITKAIPTIGWDDVKLDTFHFNQRYSTGCNKGDVHFPEFVRDISRSVLHTIPAAITSVKTRIQRVWKWSVEKINEVCTDAWFRVKGRSPLSRPKNAELAKRLTEVVQKAQYTAIDATTKQTLFKGGKDGVPEVHKRQLSHVHAGCLEEPPALQGKIYIDHGQEGSSTLINNRFQSKLGTTGGNEAGHASLHDCITGSSNGPRLGGNRMHQHTKRNIIRSINKWNHKEGRIISSDLKTQIAIQAKYKRLQGISTTTAELFVNPFPAIPPPPISGKDLLASDDPAVQAHIKKLQLQGWSDTDIHAIFTEDEEWCTDSIPPEFKEVLGKQEAARCAAVEAGKEGGVEQASASEDEEEDILSRELTRRELSFAPVVEPPSQVDVSPAPPPGGQQYPGAHGAAASQMDASPAPPPGGQQYPGAHGAAASQMDASAAPPPDLPAMQRLRALADSRSLGKPAAKRGVKEMKQLAQPFDGAEDDMYHKLQAHERLQGLTGSARTQAFTALYNELAAKSFEMMQAGMKVRKLTYKTQLHVKNMENKLIQQAQAAATVSAMAPDVQQSVADSRASGICGVESIHQTIQSEMTRAFGAEAMDCLLENEATYTASTASMTQSPQVVTISSAEAAARVPHEVGRLPPMGWMGMPPLAATTPFAHGGAGTPARLQSPMDPAVWMGMPPLAATTPVAHGGAGALARLQGWMSMPAVTTRYEGAGASPQLQGWMGMPPVVNPAAHACARTGSGGFESRHPVDTRHLQYKAGASTAKRRGPKKCPWCNKLAKYPDHPAMSSMNGPQDCPNYKAA